MPFLFVFAEKNPNFALGNVLLWEVTGFIPRARVEVAVAILKATSITGWGQVCGPGAGVLGKVLFFFKSPLFILSIKSGTVVAFREGPI